MGKLQTDLASAAAQLPDEAANFTQLLLINCRMPWTKHRFKDELSAAAPMVPKIMEVCGCSRMRGRCSVLVDQAMELGLCAKDLRVRTSEKMNFAKRTQLARGRHHPGPTNHR